MRAKGNFVGLSRTASFVKLMLVVFLHTTSADSTMEGRARIKGIRQLDFSLSGTPAPVGQPVALTMTHLQDYHATQSQTPPTLIPSPRPTPYPTGPRPTPFPTHKPPTPWPTLPAGGSASYHYPSPGYPVYVVPTKPTSITSDFPTEVPSSDPTNRPEQSAHPTLYVHLLCET